jgi:hypothetical protein
MSSLGVFYSAFNEIRAVDFSIATIKSVYPDIPIFLVSDGGENFEFILNKFNNISIHNGIDTMSNTFKITDQNFKEPKHQEAMLVCILTLFDRLKKCIDFCKSEYILMCDPDTILRGQISIKENATLLGTRLNKNGIVTNIDYQNTLRNIGVEPIDCWGATPTIFKSESFLIALEKLNSYPDLLKSLCSSTYAMFAHDFLFPTLFSLIGEKEVFNEQITECTRNPLWQYSQHPIVHQYKFLY